MSGIRRGKIILVAAVALFLVTIAVSFVLWSQGGGNDRSPVVTVSR
jgi:hypothetical protein